LDQNLDECKVIGLHRQFGLTLIRKTPFQTFDNLKTETGGTSKIRQGEARDGTFVQALHKLNRR
jgi:hypothetical protein